MISNSALLDAVFSDKVNVVNAVMTTTNNYLEPFVEYLRDYYDVIGLEPIIGSVPSDAYRYLFTEIRSLEELSDTSIDGYRPDALIKVDVDEAMDENENPENAKLYALWGIYVD